MKPFDELYIPPYVKKDEASASFNRYEDEEKRGFGFYDMLRQELKEQKEGGVDIHFSQIDVDNLSNKVLDLYRRCKKDDLSENDLKNFRNEENKLSKDEVNFVAMILNWVVNKGIDRKLAEQAKKAA